jgi:hypothetical protein
VSVIAWIAVGVGAVIVILVVLSIWHYPTDNSF